MTCKDCIHYELCELHGLNSANMCKRFFKDKSKFIEVPCRVGDTVYLITGMGYADYLFNKDVCKCDVDEISIDKFNNCLIVLNIHFDVFISRRDVCVKPNDFGKVVFFTKDEAEDKKKEIKNKISE